ncbi:dethiobiotin synthase [Paenibacillus sp. GCM10027627]|uniref:dethiobiotin synthase n=1 Tax=unclassified Paenibacillus TaxID=185978 RepID=UPI0036429383
MSGWRGLFVAGTDTDIGKTVVTGAIVAALRDEGLKLGVWKPVQSGASIGLGHTDAERLIAYSGIAERPEAVAPYSFAAPLAPYAAAQKSGMSLTLESITEAGRPLAKRYDALLVEGAGGVLVPLAEDGLVLDLMAELGLPVLIVARSTLGTVNHTLLTISCLRQKGIPITGVILNDGKRAAADGDPSVSGNAEMIERYGKVPVLGHFPYIGAFLTTEKLAAAARQNLQLKRISETLLGEFNSRRNKV